MDMSGKKVLLIAIGVGMSDIRTAMALQKLNEDDFIIINNEQDALAILEKETRTDHIILSTRPRLSEVTKSMIAQKAEPFIAYNNKREVTMRKDTHKNRLNVRPRDITRFRHPQMVRRG